MESLDNWQAPINLDPGILGGKPVVKGTRVPFWIIFSFLAGGETIAEIAKTYLIEEADIGAGLAYAAQVSEGAYDLPLPRSEEEVTAEILKELGFEDA